MISVLMPMRNAARFVEAAARSVLTQQEPLELIVINDGSTDGSERLIQRMNDARIRLIAGSEKGIAAAMNAGLKVARGDVVARCDADDLLPLGRLQWQAQFLRARSGYGAVCGHFSTMSPRGRVLAELRPEGSSCDITDELRNGTTRTHLCAFAIRTSLLRAIGGFREYFVTAEDIDLQLRLAEVARVWYEPRLAYCYRLHDASITHRQPNRQRMFFEQAARDFQLQRKAGGSDAIMRGDALPPPQGDERPHSAREQSQGHLLARAWRERSDGRTASALFTGLRACLERPSIWRVWKSWLAMLAGAMTGTLEHRSHRAR